MAEMAPDGGALLAIDIGNTNVSLGVFMGQVLRESWRISTERYRMADEYRPLFSQLLAGIELTPSRLRGVVIASVVPPVLAAIQESFEKEGVRVMVLSGALDFGIPVHYDPPTSVGADRLANAIAVQEKYGQPAIIVDLGTATTIDVLDASGAYAGGAIAPGIEISMEAMSARAFQLPRLQLQTPERAVGQTTVESIRSGTLLGWAGLVDGLIDRFRAEIDGEPVIVATGGLSSLVAPHSRYLGVVDENLTLEGLRLTFVRLKQTHPAMG